jgi:hypothetical protein
MTEYERISLMLQVQLLQGIGLLISARACDPRAGDEDEQLEERAENWHKQFNGIVGMATAAIKKSG